MYLSKTDFSGSHLLACIIRKYKNKEIAKNYPQYSEFLLSLNDRIFDLETIFKDDY